MTEINILTLFPQMFTGPLSESIIKRAVEKGVVKINLVNFRDFAEDKRGTVDDTPYGGGAGMVLKVDVIDRAIQNIVRNKRDDYYIALMTPQGKRFTQEKAETLSQKKKLILICGHYEGFDERIREHLVDEEISLGDFVLSGGEIAAMAITDAIVRLVPGVLGKDESSSEESFSLQDEEGNVLLEYPQYTKPFEYKNWKVPEVLASGNHAEIKKWRLEEAKKRTAKKRPVLD
ncbi:MAG: tRNA (guanosine(37)-N1)-methyltransferase TrmD [Patescibacteria group bacterium]|nr:tRNA (guanosine(37)-N1)-methyltransferase TrmD [Patescibacteria group bacterium]